MNVCVAVRGCGGQNVSKMPAILSGQTERGQGIRDDELITKVVIPPQTFTHIFFRKIGMRRSNAISKLTLSAAANIQNGMVVDFRASSGAGMTPMQADSGNMTLIPQRPDHMMLQQDGIETIEGPASGREVTNSSVRGLLARNLGYYVVASFLMGTQQAIQWEGILASVGNDYLVIYQPDQIRFVSGDIYSLKFVEFHEDQSPCAAGYRRRDAFQGW